MISSIRNAVANSCAEIARIANSKDGFEKLTCLACRFTECLGMYLQSRGDTALGCCEGTGSVFYGKKITALSDRLDDLGLVLNATNISSDIASLAKVNEEEEESYVSTDIASRLGRLFGRLHQMTAVVADVAVPFLWLQGKQICDLTGTKRLVLDVVGRYVMLVFNTLNTLKLVCNRVAEEENIRKIDILNSALKAARNAANCFGSARLTAGVGLASAALDLYLFDPTPPRREAYSYPSPSSVTLTMRNRSKFSRFGTTTEISQ